MRPAIQPTIVSSVAKRGHTIANAFRPSYHSVMRYFPYISVTALTVVAAVSCEKPSPQPPAGAPDIHNPADPGFAQQAPDSFRVRFSTTKGDFVIAVHRAWAPHGVDRFYNLVRAGFYDQAPVFRVRAGMWAQFGINSDPKIAQLWCN